MLLADFVFITRGIVDFPISALGIRSRLAKEPNGQRKQLPIRIPLVRSLQVKKSCFYVEMWDRTEAKFVRTLVVVKWSAC